jgi:hypothetical protein
MASRRMVPTTFFKDPDILNLSKREYRQVLLCLILFADDEGRELASAPLLAHEMGDATAAEIEEALEDLANNDLIELYQVGRHRYYSVIQWQKWQSMHRSRKIPSKHPAPPTPTELHAKGGTEHGK